MIRTAVLTISDSSFRGVREDLSGPAVHERLLEGGFTVVHGEILPDERDTIAEVLRTHADSGHFDFIVTTGGTGIAARDVTPEATREILDKELTGMGDMMRQQGLRHTRRAVLSRGTAGTRKRCFILNVPGSPRGAVQSLDAVLDLVPHIVELLRGNTAHGDEEKRAQS